jgi:hypothetical protein
MQVQRKALVIAICAGLLLYLIFAQAARLSTTPMPGGALALPLAIVVYFID